jgi:hypothetical protein
MFLPIASREGLAAAAIGAPEIIECRQGIGADLVNLLSRQTRRRNQRGFSLSNALPRRPKMRKPRARRSRDRLSITHQRLTQGQVSRCPGYARVNVNSLTYAVVLRGGALGPSSNTPI